MIVRLIPQLFCGFLASEEIAILDKTKDSTVPNLEDEETQIGLFADHLEDTVDTGGITIPAVETNST